MALMQAKGLHVSLYGYDSYNSVVMFYSFLSLNDTVQDVFVLR